MVVVADLTPAGLAAERKIKRSTTTLISQTNPAARTSAKSMMAAQNTRAPNTSSRVSVSVSHGVSGSVSHGVSGSGSVSHGVSGGGVRGGRVSGGRVSGGRVSGGRVVGGRVSGGV